MSSLIFQAVDLLHLNEDVLQLSSLTKDVDRLLDLEALQTCDVGKASSRLGRNIDAIDGNGRGRRLDEIDDVVHALGKAGDVLAIEGRNEGLMDQPVEIVGDPVGLVLQVFEMNGFHLDVFEVL